MVSPDGQRGHAHGHLQSDQEEHVRRREQQSTPAATGGTTSSIGGLRPTDSLPTLITANGRT
jgi:hypothetical protein